MRFDIDVAGRRRQLLMERTGRAFLITIDGRAWTIDAARIDANTLSLLVTGTSDAATAPALSGRTEGRRVRSHEVSLSRQTQSDLVVGVGAVFQPVGVNSGGRSRSRTGGTTDGSGVERVIAPMAGKVVRVLVQPGDTVSARQTVVVVEAMKMENALRSGRGGTVVEVHAREGASVDAGVLLLVIQ